MNLLKFNPSKAIIVIIIQATSSAIPFIISQKIIVNDSNVVVDHAKTQIKYINFK